MTDWAEFIREQGTMQQKMLKQGIRIGEERFYGHVRTLDVAYRRALMDPNTKIPSYFTAAIYTLIMMLPHGEKVEDVVNKLKPTPEQFGKLVDDAQAKLK